MPGTQPAAEAAALGAAAVLADIDADRESVTEAEMDGDTLATTDELSDEASDLDAETEAETGMPRVTEADVDGVTDEDAIRVSAYADADKDGDGLLLAVAANDGVMETLALGLPAVTAIDAAAVANSDSVR